MGRVGGTKVREEWGNQGMGGVGEPRYGRSGGTKVVEEWGNQGRGGVGEPR